MKYLSLFTGIGGFERGIEQAYENKNRECIKHECPYPHEVAECVGFSEIDKFAIETYKKHYPNHKNYGDITKINEKELPDFDLLVGGFPCQAFSIAGHRKGFADTRGTLFFDIARILAAKKPRLLLLENVKGLLSHDNGRTFYTIISTLDELGYDIQWQVLNSKNHGVPKNRERIIIVGHLRGTPRPQVFSFIGDSEEISTPINRIAHMRGFRRYNQTFETNGAVETLDTAQGGCHQPCIISKTVRSGGRASPHGSKQNWDSYDLEGGVRRLTPMECERLQGFPDNWTEGVSDTQRYKQCGNAVTVNVIETIMEKLLSIDE